MLTLTTNELHLITGGGHYIAASATIATIMITLGGAAGVCTATGCMNHYADKIAMPSATLGEVVLSGAQGVACGMATTMALAAITILGDVCVSAVKSWHNHANDNWWQQR